MNEPRSFYEFLLYSTVRITNQCDCGNSAVGTGFIYSHLYDISNNMHAPFLVTNKHVVEGGGNKCVLQFKRSLPNQPYLGNLFKFSFDKNDANWILHPIKEIDIAILPLKPYLQGLHDIGIDIHFTFHSQYSIFPNDKIEDELDAIEDIVFAGYPAGIQDEKNILPITRKGTTATPYYIDFNGEPIFLIDAGVFKGSSGSPVFIFQRKGTILKNNETLEYDRAMLLGIIAQMKLEPNIRIPIGLGVVFKSWLIKDLVDTYLNALTVEKQGITQETVSALKK